MKNFSKILGAILCTCVLVVSGLLLTACGNKAFDIKGTTLNGSGDVFFAWSETATQEDKNKIYNDLKVANDEELKEAIKEFGSDFVNCKLVFDEKGTVEITKSQDNAKLYYYSQSEDLKTINIFDDAEKTKDAGTLSFVNGYFCFKEDEAKAITIYVAFNKV